MLITGSLLSAPTTRAGQIPLKNAPLERQTDENLQMKRYVAAGDRLHRRRPERQPGSGCQPESEWNRLAHYRANGRRVGPPD